MFNVGENLSVSRKNRFADGPRLLADVGGTNARFALETAPGAIEPVRSTWTISRQLSSFVKSA